MLVLEERFEHSQVVDDLDWWSSWSPPHNVTEDCKGNVWADLTIEQNLSLVVKAHAGFLTGACVNARPDPKTS